MSEKTMIIEKRKERRRKVNLPIRIIFRNKPQIIGQIGNISRLGAYVEIDKDIPVGSDIDIIFEIPIYTKDLSLTGEVRCEGNIFRSNLVREFRSKKYYGMGIFFTNFAEQLDRDKLSKYIDFLILKEDEDIQAGIKRWREKRVMDKKDKQNRKMQLNQEGYQTETLSLLNQILIRLEEISRLLQSQDKTK
jgi:hypothetical protein